MTWSQTQIADLVNGDDVAVRSADREMFAVPDWLQAASGSVDTVSWSLTVAEIHPHDRALVIRTWWQALGAPSEVQTLTYRVRRNADTYVVPAATSSWPCAGAPGSMPNARSPNVCAGAGTADRTGYRVLATPCQHRPDPH